MTFSFCDPPTSDRVAPNKPPDGWRGEARCDSAGRTVTNVRHRTKPSGPNFNVEDGKNVGGYLVNDDRVTGKQPDILRRVLPLDDVVVVELEAPFLASFVADDDHVAFVRAFDKSAGFADGL